MADLDMERWKRAWHYTLWKASYRVWLKFPPKRVSLCRYFWRFPAMPLIIPLGAVVVGTFFVAAVIATLLYLLLMLIVGKRPKSDPADSSIDFVHYPTIKIRGFGIYPIHALGLIAVLLLIRWGSPSLGSWFLHLPGIQPFGIGVLLGGTIFWMYWLLRRSIQHYRDSDTHRLFRSWVRAKKDKLCPILDFSDPPETNN